MKPVFIIAIAVIFVTGIGLSINVSAEEKLVPAWIKNTVAFWVDGQVSDTEFLNAIGYLVSENIIQPPTPTVTAESQIYVVSATYDIWGRESSLNGRTQLVECRDNNDIAISGGFEVPYHGIFPSVVKPYGTNAYDFSLINFGSNESGGSAILYVTCMKVD